MNDSDLQAEAKKLNHLWTWIEKQIGGGPVSLMAGNAALQLVGCGLVPAGRVKQLVDAATAQGLLTPPCFLLGSLIDLCQQMGGELKITSAFAFPVVPPQPTATRMVFSEEEFEARLRRVVQPSLQ